MFWLGRKKANTNRMILPSSISAHVAWQNRVSAGGERPGSVYWDQCREVGALLVMLQAGRPARAGAGGSQSPCWHVPMLRGCLELESESLGWRRRSKISQPDLILDLLLSSPCFNFSFPLFLPFSFFLCLEIDGKVLSYPMRFWEN